MLEHLTGIPAVGYYHTISDAHIYVDQIESVTQMLERKPRPLPTVHLTNAGRAVRDIHDFRAEHFMVSDYDPHPPISRIPVAT
jgi:thymidylate synthase